METLSIILVSFLSGLTASMGLGGGMILIIYLGLFTSLSQLEAQGINLVFFIPIALLSLVFHCKNKLVDKKAVAISAVPGLLAVIISAFAAYFIHTYLLRKIFAAFIFLIGVKQFFSKNKKPPDD